MKRPFLKFQNFQRPKFDPDEIVLPNKWKPRSDQIKLWSYLENGGLRAVQVAHRRWGKDDVALHFTAVAAMQRVGNYWHMLPEYSHARKVIWTAVNPRTNKFRIEDAFPQTIRANTKNQEMMIEFKNGSTWQLVGSDNYNSLVGAPPVGIVFSEWALASPICWPYMEPILEENNGWALFIYTSRGNNHGKTMVQHALADSYWYGDIIPATKSSVFSSEQLDRILDGLVSIYGPDHGQMIYNQEYMCSFDGLIYGAYYAKQMNDARDDNRITSVPHATGIEVDTFWDLGVDDSMAIWFMQPVGREFRFIEYYENTGYGLEHYAKILKSKSYIYGNHYMPHDAGAREMTNNEIALSRQEVAENLGIKPIIRVQRARSFDLIINVHIPAVRNILSQCIFDQKKCSQGIMALEGYHADFDEEKKVLGTRPAGTWHRHGADAFRTFAVGYEPKRKPLNLLSGLYANPDSWML